MSYHLREIDKGEFGELSKIYEEVEELKDSEQQAAKIMIINELCDIIGAIEGYLERHHPSVTVQDLIEMKALTKRAFESGRRT